MPIYFFNPFQDTTSTFINEEATEPTELRAAISFAAFNARPRETE